MTWTPELLPVASVASPRGRVTVAKITNHANSTPVYCIVDEQGVTLDGWWFDLPNALGRAADVAQMAPA